MSLFIFASGMITGAIIMFLARIADKKITSIVQRFEDNDNSFVRPKPKIIKPPSDDRQVHQQMQEELEKQLAKDYGNI